MLRVVMRHSNSTLITISMLISASACDEASKPATGSDSFRYTVYFDRADIPGDTEIRWKGKTVGRVDDSRQVLDGGVEVSKATVELPKTAKEQFETDPLSISVTTPCGPRDGALRLTKPPSSVLWVSLADDASGPKPTRVYHDFPVGSEVRIGEAVLLPGRSHEWPLAGLACAARHVITVDGEPAGEFDVTPELESALFIPADPERCYRLESAVYGEPDAVGGGGSQTMLQGQRVYPIPFPRIDRWMVEAQGSLRVDKTVDKAAAYAISPIECPTTE